MAAMREKAPSFDVWTLDFSTDLSTVDPEIYHGSGDNAKAGLLSSMLRRGQNPSGPRSPKVTHLVSPYTWSPMRKKVTMVISCVTAVFASVAASA